MFKIMDIYPIKSGEKRFIFSFGENRNVCSINYIESFGEVNEEEIKNATSWADIKIKCNFITIDVRKHDYLSDSTKFTNSVDHEENIVYSRYKSFSLNKVRDIIIKFYKITPL